MEFFPRGVLGVHLIPACVPGTVGMREHTLLAGAGTSAVPIRRERAYLISRLLHLPTFSHPTVVRVSQPQGWKGRRASGSLMVEAAECPGRLVFEAERDLFVGEAKRLNRLIERLGFWELPTFEACRGVDGTQCVVEAARPGGHHVVDRWSPRG